MCASQILWALMSRQIQSAAVAIPSSGFHNTVASVLHNQICRLLLLSHVLLFLFLLPTFLQCLKPFLS